MIARTVGRQSVALLVRLRLEETLSRAVAAELRRRPSSRFLRRLGWHLGEAAAPALRVAHPRDGGRLLVDISDHSQRAIYFEGVYEPPTTRLLRRVARRGWTFVDVGANAGYYTNLASQLGGPEGTVIAFEPNPQFAQRLETLSGWATANVVVVQAGCGDREEVLPLAISADARNAGLSTLRPPAATVTAAGTDVPVVRLDSWCDENAVVPDVVKIDVEGFETEVLLGMEQLLADRVPRLIVCELAEGRASHSPAEIIALMREHAYDAAGIECDGTLGPLRPHPTSDFNICFSRAG
jgi:FkbM family methyltransferase